MNEMTLGELYFIYEMFGMVAELNDGEIKSLHKE